MTEGFLLGLSTGVVCVAYCGPVLIPYLMAESGGLKKSILFVLFFLSGRLTAYLTIAVIAGTVGKAMQDKTQPRLILTGIAYIVLSALLIIYGFYRFREICLGKTTKVTAKKKNRSGHIIAPFTGGFLTGINICPPLLLAVTGAIDSGSITVSLKFFLAFFAGTSVFFLPMPFAGMFRRQQVVRIIGKFAALIAGIIYLYKGLVLLISCLQS